MRKLYEGQELRSLRTGWHYEYIKPVEGDDKLIWCELIPVEFDEGEHIGIISKDRLEPVIRCFVNEAYREVK